MIRLATALLLLAAGAGTAEAQTLAVRSGEHPTFSRLVLEPPAGTGWRVGRTPDGYELRLDREGLAFDTRRVFDLIPRRRIAGLEPGKVPSSLSIRLACECYATAFETRGALVIDVADGLAPAGSPFELPLDSQTAAAEAQPLPVFGGPPEVQPDPWTDTYWALSTERNATADDTGGTEARPSLAADPRPATASPRPSDAGGEPIGVAEADLLRELARAASQGLVDPAPALRPAEAAGPGGRRREGEGIGSASEGAARPDIPPRPQAARGPHVPPDRTAAAPSDQKGAGIGPGQGAEAPGGPSGVDRIGLRADTSIDRDTLSVRSREPTTPDGRICPPDADFDVEQWVSADPPADQIGKARAGLVGEFDRPNREAVVALARLYVAFGFGEEAIAALDAFAIPDDESRFVRALATVIEDRIPADPSLSTLAGCGGKVAMWSMLAQPVDTAKGNDEAALRTFSALRPELRRLVGPRLADRFIRRGQLDAARSVLEAMRRLPGPLGADVDLLSARLSLEARKVAPALEELGKAIAANEPSAPEAVVLAIRTRLESGLPVDPALVDTAGALAFELRGSQQGLRLAAAHAAAIAARGDFAGAFAALDLHRADSPDGETANSLNELLAMLAESADDRAFLSVLFDRRAELMQSPPPLDLRLKLAERLAGLGFSDEVARLLGPDGRTSRAGRLALAEAALRDLRPETALASVAGLDGPQAADLADRAAAMVRFSGAPAAAAEPPVSDAAPQTRPPEEGPLAKGRALLDESKALRGEVAKLIGPAPP